MADHDNSYKQLFSHAEMVADLLRGFVPEEWVGKLDCSTLEKTGTEYVSEDLKSRESDVVWRLRWRDGESFVFVYILLELQSRSDRYMAVRMMTYLGLLYQDLLRNRVLTPAGLLPPVLPIVLYNGNVPWTAARQLADLVAPVPGGLEQYCPRLRYVLLDEGRTPVSEADAARNFVAALIRIEQAREVSAFERAFSLLEERLRSSEHRELRAAFLAWITKVYLPARVPDVDLPALNDLQEVKRMLAEDKIDWSRSWKEMGREEGRLEGRQEGRREIVDEVRSLLLRHLEERFGPLPGAVLRQVESMETLEGLTALMARAGAAPSLDALGLKVENGDV